MYPVLVSLPLPRWNVPLLPALLALALLLAALSLLGWRRGLKDLLLIGASGATACVIAAIVLRGATYRLEPIPIHTYGVMLCASLVVGWHLTLRLAERAGLPKVQAANCYFWTALAGLLGARLLYVITNFHEFSQPLELFDFRSGGLVAYGGFLGGLAGSAVYARRRGLSWLGFCDAAVPSVAAGLGLTRIGCYAFGCDFGKPLSDGAPGWLRTLGTFPHWPEGTLAHGSGSPAWLSHVTSRGLPYESPSSLAVHPTQLYESLVGLSLLGMLLWLGPRRRFAGQLLLCFAFGYGVLRFWLELLRDDPERGAFGPFLPVAWLSVLALLGFGVAYCLGPARLARSREQRWIGLLVWPLLALGCWLWLGKSSLPSAQLSTSQWLALGSVVLAGVAWSAVERLKAAGAPADNAPAPHP